MAWTFDEFQHLFIGTPLTIRCLDSEGKVLQEVTVENLSQDIIFHPVIDGVTVVSLDIVGRDGAILPVCHSERVMRPGDYLDLPGGKWLEFG
ncbi:MAG: hypothetical protein ABFE13_12195 [Phycisphaerales bacterium]